MSSQQPQQPQPVQTTHQGPITIITLNRPLHKNAVDAPAARMLGSAFRRFEEDAGALVAILTGAGGTFCAGADLKAVAAGSARVNELRRVEMGWDGPMGPSRLALSKPVIAAVSDYAVAGGLELACWCDLRVCEEQSIFGVFCRRYGVPLIDGGTMRLPRLIGLSRALDMILTGRPVGAQEALAMGLVNRVVEKGQSLSAALALAQQIASFPQQCMRADRASAYAGWHMDEYAALRDEFDRAANLHVMMREGVAGAQRFVSGVGRHGVFPATATSTATSTTTATSTNASIRAVLFDLGGVVLSSPVLTIEKYTAALGLPKYSLNRTMSASKLWHQLECGQLALEDFQQQFAAETEQKLGRRVDVAALFQRINQEIAPRPIVVECIRRLRHRGYTVGALTNNWKTRLELAALVGVGDGGGGGAHANTPPKASGFVARVHSLFDVVVESAIEGMRKPDPRIFRRALDRMDVADAARVVFVDDIGRNVKAAAALGFRTIKVDMRDHDGTEMVKKLEISLGLPPSSLSGKVVSKL